MRALSTGALLLVAAACQPNSSSPVAEARADEIPTARVAGDGVAVVELFTSEGCSSCPPADAVLGELVRSHAGHPVFALAFHVDYWDDLGWPDRFASPDFTARQGTYAKALRARGLYTPQMVVGGTEQFTGSDRDRADEAIARALTHLATVQLTLRARRSTPDTVAVEWTAAGTGPGETLSVALVESSTSTVVRAGENAGRTLRHTNVVRSFTTAPLATGPGSRTLPIPPGSEQLAVIAYAQRATAGGGMPVDGAASVSLTP
ncbi:MAG TPA: DUF1223 domain-containing protein [Polyangiaceae bacterium]